MLDIKGLERRWLKYKIKSYAPYFLTAVLILTLLIVTSFWLSPQESTDTISIKQEPIPVQKVPKNQEVQNNDENITFLEPSMEFVQAFQNVPTPTEPKAIVSETNKPLHKSPVVPKTLNVPEYTPAPIQPVSKALNNDKTLTINRNESKLDIEDLQQRFKETSNPNLGLFIARYYYDRGNYEESYNYALKTNNANNRIDESWIIFSKSLVKLGKIDQAKKTLQLYISQSNSDSARGLLDAIEKGNFK